jgi:hypothetical protein
MSLTSKMSKGIMKGTRKSADERTKKFLGLPGYDESTEMAQKEVAAEIAKLKKIEASRKLTAREEKALDRLMNRRVREGGSETAGGASKKQKPKALSEREKKEMQESLEFKKGGMVKKYSKGGMGTKANCGASMKPAQKAKK